MMPARRAAVACAFFAFASAALADTVVADKSQIRFAARQMGVSVEGRFRKFKPDVVFSRSEPAKAKIAIDVELGSVDFGNEETETEVKGPIWFDAARFPTARFVSTSVKDLGGGKLEVAGNFTLKGITKTLVVPMVLKDEAGGTFAEGTFSLKRLDYKLGSEGAWSDTDTVANDVIVRVRMALAK